MKERTVTSRATERAIDDALSSTRGNVGSSALWQALRLIDVRLDMIERPEKEPTAGVAPVEPKPCDRCQYLQGALDSIRAKIGADDSADLFACVDALREENTSLWTQLVAANTAQEALRLANLEFEALRAKYEGLCETHDIVAKRTIEAEREAAEMSAFLGVLKRDTNIREGRIRELEESVVFWKKRTEEGEVAQVRADKLERQIELINKSMMPRATSFTEVLKAQALIRHVEAGDARILQLQGSCAVHSINAIIVICDKALDADGAA